MPTVLLVDDIDGIHEMLDFVFENTSVKLVHASLAPRALEIFQQEKIDLVLSDIIMPGMDGLELLEKLKAIDPALTMIMMTGSEDRDYVVRALRLGAFDFITKPFDESELMDIIKRAMAERQRRLAQSCGEFTSSGELETLRKELALRDEAISQLEAKDAEIEHLRAELEKQKSSIDASESKRQELEKLRQELEIKEGAMQNMESVLKERMEKLKTAKTEQQNASKGRQISAEDQAALESIQAKLAQREAELEEREAGIIERESLVTETEESLMDKGMRLQELEAELEQMREDMQTSGISGSMGSEEQAEFEAMKNSIAEKERALLEMEESIREKQRSIKKAEALIKAREQFLAQSESILFGESQA